MELELENNKNKELSEKLLSIFDNNLMKISKFNLSYKILTFFGTDLDLFDYKDKKNNYIFYKDKSGVETHISVYKSIDKFDDSEGIVFELIIGNTKQKDIMFFSEGKIYNIIQNKWGKIIDTKIIENEYRIEQILILLEVELNYMNNKILRYQNKLREKGILNKKIINKQVEKFKLNFKQNILSFG